MTKYVAAFAVLLGCGSMALADRGDRYDRRGGWDRGRDYRHYDRGYDRGHRHDRGRSDFSIGFGFSSGNYYGDRSYLNIGVNRSYNRGYYGRDFCSPAPVYVAPRPVVVERPVYVAPAPVYVAPPTYYYNNCPPTYYERTTTYYYGR